MMSKLILINREGDAKDVPGQEGLSVMELIRDASDGEIMALCGGCCSCATCHVYVEGPSTLALQPMSADENELLSGSNHRKPSSRLACQIPFSTAFDGLRVTVAPED
jgi:2Fe-2S ferredoxin